MHKKKPAVVTVLVTAQGVGGWQWELEVVTVVVGGADSGSDSGRGGWSGNMERKKKQQ